MELTPFRGLRGPHCPPQNVSTRDLTPVSHLPYGGMDREEIPSPVPEAVGELALLLQEVGELPLHSPFAALRKVGSALRLSSTTELTLLMGACMGEPALRV